MTGEVTETPKERILDMDEINVVTQNINFGLVPTNLLVLINQYYMIDKVMDDHASDAEKDIGLLLRKEIIDG